MKKKLLSISFVLSSAICFSQNENLSGTYQLMTTNIKVQEVFTTDLLTTIKENRKEKEINIIKVGKYTWVKILSRETIQDSNFTPLKNEVIQVESADLK